MYYTFADTELSYRITKREFTKWLRDTINHYRKWLKWECKRGTLEKHDMYWIIKDIDILKEYKLWVEVLGWYYSFNFENKYFRDSLLERFIYWFSKTQTQLEKAQNYYF